MIVLDIYDTKACEKKKERITGSRVRIFFFIFGGNMRGFWPKLQCRQKGYKIGKR